jgi:hypothetical protein
MRRITKITDVLSCIPGMSSNDINSMIESEQIRINDSIASVNSICIDSDIIHFPDGKLDWKSEYFLKGTIS